MAVDTPSRTLGHRALAHLRRRLSGAIGQSVQLIDVHRDGPSLVRGLAVCPGRILSFVLDADQQRFWSHDLYALVSHRRLEARLSSAPGGPW